MVKVPIRSGRPPDYRFWITGRPGPWRSRVTHSRQRLYVPRKFLARRRPTLFFSPTATSPGPARPITCRTIRKRGRGVPAGIDARNSRLAHNGRIWRQVQRQQIRRFLHRHKGLCRELVRLARRIPASGALVFRAFVETFIYTLPSGAGHLELRGGELNRQPGKRLLPFSSRWRGAHPGIRVGLSSVLAKPLSCAGIDPVTTALRILGNRNQARGVGQRRKTSGPRGSGLAPQTPGRRPRRSGPRPEFGGARRRVRGARRPAWFGWDHQTAKFSKQLGLQAAIQENHRSAAKKRRPLRHRRPSLEAVSGPLGQRFELRPQYHACACAPEPGHTGLALERHRFFLVRVRGRQYRRRTNSGLDQWIGAGPGSLLIRGAGMRSAAP